MTTYEYASAIMDSIFGSQDEDENKPKLKVKRPLIHTMPQPTFGSSERFMNGLAYGLQQSQDEYNKKHGFSEEDVEREYRRQIQEEANKKSRKELAQNYFWKECLPEFSNFIFEKFLKILSDNDIPKTNQFLRYCLRFFCEEFEYFRLFHDRIYYRTVCNFLEEKVQNEL